MEDKRSLEQQKRDSDVAGALTRFAGFNISLAAQLEPSLFLPEHFRIRLTCPDCSATMELDAHFTTAIIDTWLAGHLKAFPGHKRYHLQLMMD